jgi:hypothetical protein
MRSVQCLLCYELLPLPIAQPGASVDLAGFIRTHLQEHAATAEGMKLLAEHMGRTGWILDLLAFDSPDHATGYRELLGQAVEQALQSRNRIEVMPS